MVEEKIEALADYEIQLLEGQDEIELLIDDEQSRQKECQSLNKNLTEENEKLKHKLESLKVTLGLVGIMTC
jgi:hypothetical protein